MLLICEHCRRRMPEEARFCPRCGRQASERRRSAGVPVGALVFLFVVAGALMLALVVGFSQPTHVVPATEVYVLPQGSSSSSASSLSDRPAQGAAPHDSGSHGSQSQHQW
jgi:hypothetical protein